MTEKTYVLVSSLTSSIVKNRSESLDKVIKSGLKELDHGIYGLMVCTERCVGSSKYERKLICSIN